jgi:hypothetical protein
MGIRSGIDWVRGSQRAPSAGAWCGALLIVAGLLPATAGAQDKDNLWEITMKMEMPGMPMVMPAQTIQQCLAQNSTDDDYLPRRDNCRVLESQRTGNRVTFKMACSAPEAMDITGEMNLGHLRRSDADGRPGCRSVDGDDQHVLREAHRHLHRASEVARQR